MALLEVLNGPGAGTVHTLSESQTVLGRHNSCGIVLTAGKVSRRHAQIMVEPGGYFLEDLQSRNGTFLNGQEVGGRVRLRDNDLLEVADTQLRFRLEQHEQAAQGDAPNRPSEDAVPADRPRTQPPHIVRSLDAFDAAREPINAAAQLKAMIDISQHLGSSLDLDEVLPKILDCVFRIFPQADRGYILLAKAPTGRLEPHAMKLRRDESGFALTIRPISRTITEKVFAEGRGILSSDVLSDERFQSSASVLDFEIRSMICVPLIGASRRPLGILYVDTQDPDHQFTEADLNVLLSIATFSAQSVESARVHRELIDERRMAEETLRNSEMRFRAVWDTSSNAMRLTDRQGIVVAVNQAYCQLVGLQAGEVEGRPFSDVYAEDEDGDAMLREYQGEFVSKSRYRQRERTLTLRSGRRLDVEIRNSFLEVEPGTFYLLSIFRDLTEHKRTEAALRESENRFGILFHEARLGIAIGDPDGRLVQVNPSLEQILGADRDELLSRRVAEITHPDRPQAGEQVVRQLLDGVRHEYRSEKRLTRAHDGTLWGNILVSVVRSADGSPKHLIVMIENISERKRLEKEVADLAVAEQQRIGQELHDDLGQILTGLGYLSGSLVARLKTQQSPEVESVEQLSDGLRQALAQVRGIARGLVPVEIDEEGLQAALAEMVARVADVSGVRCELDCPVPVRVPDSATAVHLYHITQEAVTNALKHGHADWIRVELTATDGETRLTVTDNGAGFDSGDTQPTGIGTRIMRYRAGIIGATFDLQSAPGEGTMMNCVLQNDR